MKSINSRLKIDIKRVLAVLGAIIFVQGIVYSHEITAMYSFANLADNWLKDDCQTPCWCNGSDFNTDGAVDINDLLILNDNWPVIVGILGITWVEIDELGFSGHISKYETTNAQYADFLNSLNSVGSLIIHANNYVYSVADVNFLTPYFSLYSEDNTSSQIVYANGGFSVRVRDGYDMSNHPVVLVTLGGAKAFCDFYGYRLPTKSEWEAVADYDGSYYYGCGNSVDPSLVNYGQNNPLALTSYPYTTPVNYYSSAGYGVNDMAGNVWEWTSTFESKGYVTKGSDWRTSEFYCSVATSRIVTGTATSNGLGFRVCC